MTKSLLMLIIEKIPQASKLKVGDRVRITKHNNIFSKIYTEKWSRKICVIDSVLKAIPWMHKIKDLDKKNNRNLL